MKHYETKTVEKQEDIYLYNWERAELVTEFGRIGSKVNKIMILCEGSSVTYMPVYQRLIYAIKHYGIGTSKETKFSKNNPRVKTTWKTVSNRELLDLKDIMKELSTYKMPSLDDCVYYRKRLKELIHTSIDLNENTSELVTEVRTKALGFYIELEQSPVFADMREHMLQGQIQYGLIMLNYLPYGNHLLHIEDLWKAYVNATKENEEFNLEVFKNIICADTLEDIPKWMEDLRNEKELDEEELEFN